MNIEKINKRIAEQIKRVEISVIIKIISLINLMQYSLKTRLIV